MHARDIRMVWVACLVGLLVMIVGPLMGCSQPRSEVTDLGRSELAQEVRSALAEPFYLDRNIRLASALTQLSPDNVEAVAELFNSLLKHLREAELEPFFDAWAEFDPQAAFDYALEVPYQGVSQTSLRAAMYAWAVRDALGASLAADQGAAARRRDAHLFYQALIEGWAISGQDGLEDYIVDGPFAKDPGQLILAAQPEIYLRDGVDGLFEWSESIMQRVTDHGSRMKAFRYAVRTAGFRDPRAAVAFVERHYGADYAEEGPRVLVETWAYMNPEDAFAWLRYEAPEATRADALAMAMGKWLVRDRQAARSWIDSVPVGDPYYQPAFDIVAKRIANHDPMQAIEWCHRGRPLEVNSACLRQVAIIWYGKDPVAAGDWMEGDSGLSVEGRVSVRERAAKNRKQRH